MMLPSAFTESDLTGRGSVITCAGNTEVHANNPDIVNKCCRKTGLRPNLNDVFFAGDE